MAASNVALPDLVIPAGAAVSNVLNSEKSFGDALAIAMYSASALEAHTYTIEVCPLTLAVAGSTFFTLQTGDTPADSAPPAAGKARVYYELASCMAFRIRSDANVTGAQTFKATKSIDI